MTIHTNGGDVSIVLEGTKIILPDEYNLESFESGTFPPVGWTADKGWTVEQNLCYVGRLFGFLQFCRE